MKLSSFSKAADLTTQSELEKVRRLAYFFYKEKEFREFGVLNVVDWFSECDFHRPNLSRLRSRIETSKSFVKGSHVGMWRLHALDLNELQQTFPDLTGHSEEIESSDQILPLSLYQKSRGFVESLAKQINASYENHIYDGCAVMMRRLIEVLLILTYEHNSIDAEIRDGNGQYMPLERVIASAKEHPKLKLSRDSKSTLDEMRSLGNFAAHKIYFNTRSADIERIAANYRATVEELLYKSGIRT